MAPLTLHSVLALLIISTDDRSRLLAKYYSPPHTSSTVPTPSNPYPTLKEQKAFEKGLLEKTNKSTSDVILYDGQVVVFKCEGDVMMYIVGGAEENEILLGQTVVGLRDSLGLLLK